MIELVKLILSRRGYDVFGAPGGREGLELVKAIKPNLVLLDLMMPDMDGWEVYQAMKADEDMRHIPVIVVTSKNQETDRIWGMRQGASDYLVKPIDAGRLATTVARLKARLRQQPADLDALLAALACAIPRKPYVRWLTASHRDELRLITVDEICYVKADNKYVVVVTADGDSLLRRPIRELAEDLDPDVFWQVHRSTLVNVHAIAGIARDFGGRLRIRLRQRPETLAVSESFAHLFRSI